MDDLTKALKGQPKPINFSGFICELTRPTVLDAVVLAEFVSKNPGEDLKASAWLLARHLHRDGKPVFPTLEDAMLCDWAAVKPLLEQVNALYSEGGN